mmetsp:Transcript_20775/g.45061  ORF Transcript_20775/g.45061 Transcript_20775/m.45061 type:complete len:832 (+) Transcript_20775:71-2566(+)
MAEMAQNSCNGCHKQFSSKNQLFRHLNQSAKTCLSPEEYKVFLDRVLATKREKIGVLYGYLPGTDYRFGQHDSVKNDAPCGVEGGQHAAWLVTQAIDRVNGGASDALKNCSQWSADAAVDSKIKRSYGSNSRESDSLAQDPHTGAITEVLCTTAVPLFIGEEGDADTVKATDEQSKAEKEFKKKTLAWVESVNEELNRILAEMTNTRSIPSMPSNEFHKWSPGRIRVFGRIAISQKKFNAETDITHRRVDYCFPADMLFASTTESVSQTALQPDTSSLQEYLDSLPSFTPGSTYSAGENSLSREQAPFSTRPNDKTLTYLYQMKMLMKRITTQVEEIDDKDEGAALEKEYHDAKRKKKKRKGQKDTESSTTNNKHESSDTSRPLTSKPQLKVKRKRFHNFCPTILAHDYLAFRRVDRIFHRVTIRLEGPSNSDRAAIPLVSCTTIQNRPFIVFSLSGDLFLQQQAVRIVGLLIAICRGVIDEDIIDCIFEEEFTNLVPAPPAPRIGLLSGEVTYAKWEGRMAAILNARRTDRYSKGWNDEEVVSAVEEWEMDVLHDVARGWYCEGEGEDGRLNTETQWLENVLYPWAKKTQVLMEDYRSWKASRATNSTVGNSFLPSLESIDPAAPPIFETVLFHLRRADQSNLWPSTSAGRQLVMLTTSNEESQARTLTVAHMNVKINTKSESSAYSFKEGEGGASGSFSVGAMPGQCSQPKGNLLFPELVKAAFELEVALFPDREPSSTIAINRNAQFRPHTDNGAGAGQSTSLIVGLGTYAGGELVVEGAKKDIRYKAIEFDGWKERHWTLPFQGERYSLVWFTPKGCEGVRGIDLKL